MDQSSNKVGSTCGSGFKQGGVCLWLSLQTGWGLPLVQSSNKVWSTCGSGFKQGGVCLWLSLHTGWGLPLAQSSNKVALPVAQVFLQTRWLYLWPRLQIGGVMAHSSQMI